MQEGYLRREISVPHGVLLLVGSVIGASAFILIGPLAGQTGPALWLSYILAAIPALFVAVVCAQLGSAFPITGATYISVSRLLSPFLSLLMVWCCSLATFLFAMPLMAFGFAMYLGVVIPAPLVLTAIIILVFFTILNTLGIKWMMWVQSIFTVIALLALLVFGFGGSFFANPEYQTPLFPLGFGAIAAAVIPAYVMYTGLNGMTELGGEIKNARRNIPRIIFGSLILLTLIYVSITYALTGLMPWQVAGETEGALAIAAGEFLPQPFALYFMGIGALLAAATTINGAIAFFSRDVLALGKDLVFPSVFGRINKWLGTPVWAILLLGVLSIAGLLLGESIVRYATVVSFGFMFMALIACIAMFVLPRKMRERYDASSFKLRGFWHPFFTIGGTLIFAALIIIGCVNDPMAAAYLAILIVTGVIYYYARRWQLRKQGISIEQRLSKVEEF